MTSIIRLKGRDFGGELTQFKMFVPTVTAANFDAISTELDAIQAAVNNVTVGDFTGKQLNAVDVQPVGQAADSNAQRERKWLVRYTDNVNPIGNGSFEIGMADTSLLVAGTENMDVSGGAGAVLVQALESDLVSRLGNAITVASIKLVGRAT